MKWLTIFSAIVICMAANPCISAEEQIEPQLAITVVQNDDSRRVVDCSLIRVREGHCTLVSQMDSAARTSTQSLPIGTNRSIRKFLLKLIDSEYEDSDKQSKRFVLMTYLDSTGTLLSAHIPVNQKNELVLAKDAAYALSKLDNLFENLPFAWASPIRSIFNKADPKGNGGVPDPNGIEPAHSLWAPLGTRAKQVEEKVSGTD